MNLKVTFFVLIDSQYSVRILIKFFKGNIQHICLYFPVIPQMVKT